MMKTKMMEQENVIVNMEKIINDKILERLITIANNNLIEDRHCSYCKYFYCNNASMYCSHPTKCHKITAKRKNGCKYFEKN